MDITTVLIIDESIEFLADSMAFLISDRKLKVFCAFSREEAEEKIRNYNPGIIVLDLGMNNGDKISALKNLRSDAPVILMTSEFDSDDYPELSREIGADAYCLKKRFKTAFPKLIQYLENGLSFAAYRKELCVMK
jgi:DNA-binding response OmpR family regulator